MTEPNWKGNQTMRAVVQRVSRAAVRVEGKSVGEVEQGLCIMLGVTTQDGETQCDYLAEKISNLRIFEDENQKMNCSIKDIHGGAWLFLILPSVRKQRKAATVHLLLWRHVQNRQNRFTCGFAKN